METILRLLLFTFILTSCAQRSFNSHNCPIQVYSINPTNGEKIFASSIFDSLIYLPLETTNISLIGSIDKMEIFNSRYYLLDKKTKKIWCYSQTGQYIFQIDKRGKGPGEYIDISDFDIDHDRQQILILDRNIRRILVYTLDGAYIKDIKLNVTPREVKTMKKHLLLYTSGVDIYMGKSKGEFGYNLFLTDTLGNIQDCFFLYNDKTDNLWGTKAFTSCSDKIFFHYANNDTIYGFEQNSGELTEKILFDFGKNRIPVESIPNEKMMYEYRNIPDYANISNIYFSNQYLFITYGFERRVRFVLVNRNTTKMENGSFLENDLDDISFANPTPINISDNRIYFIKDAGEIFHQKKEGIHVYKTVNNLSSLNEESNPVIAVGYLKK